jgi:mono/diheme cytochrome c family protein
MRRAIIAPAMLAAALASAAWAAGVPSPNLGQAPSAEQLADIDISIPPDGRGLPAGSGSVAQGGMIFAAKCQACHGPNGVGGPNDRLTGGIGSLATPKPVKTVASFWPYATTVFDYIRRAMPLTAPQSLTNDEAYALTAYLLSVDGIVPKDAVLDAKSLPQVRMPNREGFVSWAAKEQPDGVR